MEDISIITPFKNTEKYIEETCKSITLQAYPKWEWILINDHSSEYEEKILQRAIQKHPIKIINNEGFGIIDALKTGLKAATGNYITRMDADDLMPKDKLSLFVNTLKNNEIDIVTGKVSYFSDSRISKGYLNYQKWLNNIVDNHQYYEQIYRECTVASGNWMMKTSLLKEIDGFNNIEYPEDYDLLFKWYKHGLRIKGVDKVTHLWREHPDRTSRNHEHYQQKSFFNLKIKRFLKLDYDPKSTLVLNGTGKKANFVAKILLNNQIPFHWVSHQPEKFKGKVYGKEIQHYSSIQEQINVQVLNAVMVNNEELYQVFSQKNEKVNIFFL